MTLNANKIDLKYFSQKQEIADPFLREQLNSGQTVGI